MYYEEWLPHMLRMNVPYELCGRMNPRKLKPIEKAYEESEKKKDYDMWSLGGYFYAALATLASNMFKKKGQPQVEYLEAPFHVLKHERDIAEGKVEMTEEERAERVAQAFESINEQLELAAINRKEH